MRPPRKLKVNTIYIVRSSATSKVYIGQTWYSLQTRLTTHKRNARNGSGGISKLYNSMRKYGSDTFTINKLAEASSQERADELEDLYILQFDSINEGLNLKRGGAMGEYSEESRKKMSKSKTGEKNNRYGIIGESHPMFGKHHTDEAIQKISESQMGDKHWTYGQVTTNEQRAHLITASAKAKLVNAKVTEEQVREIKRLLQTSMKIKDIAIQFSVSRDVISNIKRGKTWGSIV